MHSDRLYRYRKVRGDPGRRWLIAVLALACVGCASTSPKPFSSNPPADNILVGQSGVQFDLPLPLDATRQTSGNHHERLLLGAGFDELLPHERVSIQDDFARYAPNWNPQADPPAFEPAFAIYNFNLDDRGGTPVVWFCWDTPPQSWDDLMIGIANWEQNTWEWFAGPPEDRLELTALDPYVSAEGVMLVMTILMGSNECVLKWVQAPRLGITDIEVTGEGGNYILTLNYFISDLESPYEVEAQVGFDTADGDTPVDAFGVSGFVSCDLFFPSSSGFYRGSFYVSQVLDNEYLIALKVTTFTSNADVYWYPWKITVP